MVYQEDLLPRTWRKYIDVIFTIAYKDKVQEMLQVESKVYWHQQFTMAIEGRKLPFLALKIIKEMWQMGNLTVI